MSDLIDRQVALEAIKYAEFGCEYEAIEQLPAVGMRLIDADALKERMLAETPEHEKGVADIFFEAVAAMIDEQPTIEPERKTVSDEEWTKARGGWTNQPERKKGEWIPCSERLPVDSGWYIVTKNFAYDTTWVGLEWYNHENEWKYDNTKCIAWMPLPEPYEERKNDEQIR